MKPIPEKQKQKRRKVKRSSHHLERVVRQLACEELETTDDVLATFNAFPERQIVSVVQYFENSIRYHYKCFYYEPVMSQLPNGCGEAADKMNLKNK